jgi:serralysin
MRPGVSGTGDFNGDHTDDILFRSDNGQVATWSMQGGSIASIKVAGSAGPGSHIQGTGDFNGDGQTDVLFRNDDGHVVTWLMNNGQASAVVDIGSVPASAHIAGTGDSMVTARPTSCSAATTGTLRLG